jgi:hypothetical protein
MPRWALRPKTATLAPAEASALAIAPPRAPVPPTTTATRFSNEKRLSKPIVALDFGDWDSWRTSGLYWMQIQGRWQGRFGQVFSDLSARSTTFESLHLRAFAFLSFNSRDLCARSPTFASLHLRAFAFLSSNKPGSLREIHYLCVFAIL